MLARIVDAAHLLVADRLAVAVDEAVAGVGLSADVYIADTSQRVLTSMGTAGARRIDLAGTLPGRAYQVGETLPGTDEGDRVLWVPVLDGTDRLGVLRIGLDDRDRGAPGADDPELRRWLFTLGGLVGHIVATKTVYSDRLRRWRSDGKLTAASELLWQLLPPRTFATDRIVVSAVLEPHKQVAGDAFDYNVDGDVVDLAVFDAVGHDLRASMTTALAITAVRNARRAGEEDLVAIAARADELIGAQPGPRQFATAVLARLDTATGMIDVLNAGHPPPLLIRGGKVVKELGTRPRLPLGVEPLPGRPVVAEVRREQLEPGDRLLFHTDGITEARDTSGAFFGEERLVEFTEHAAASGLSAPEVLRRLVLDVLDHQDGELQDDATLLLVEWSHDAHLRMYPTPPGPPAGG
ncbi:MAG: Serine phosphatase RsbU, regulator of sigma subunit [uncultured Pseudonocardia sp.]|uniref:Serine phosphatase RsbU, regulator of sigma subunit n=1 Tax=uncultured Pseudonocardia sp. TaxID=211455 RepID=A0A6J4ND75_9PSEU|nr:MAG: Serine phosphatase RsbU, regulator of sigma subunit [uncultured Pseudonocardia sp.]